LPINKGRTETEGVREHGAEENFWTERQVAKGCRRLYNELHSLYASPNIIRATKSIEFWSENLKGRDYSKDLGIGGRVTLEWILR
jgi:hypothetical protein